MRSIIRRPFAAADLHTPTHTHIRIPLGYMSLLRRPASNEGLGGSTTSVVDGDYVSSLSRDYQGEGDGDGDVASVAARVMAASVYAMRPFVPRTITLPCATLS